MQAFICEWCGNPFIFTTFRRFCTQRCFLQWDAVKLAPENSGMVGARSELIVATALISRGWYPFRNLCASGPVDLIAYKDGKMVPIDVKTGTQGNSKSPVTGVHYVPVRPGGKVDLRFLLDDPAKA